MSVDELLARFSDACLREFWTRHAGRGEVPLDVELRNKIVVEIGKIGAELGRRRARDRLLPCLESANITERAEAARATIEVAPERATKILEEAAVSKDSYENGRAANSLEHYEKKAMGERAGQ